MEVGDHAYFEARAEQEIVAAQKARDVRAVRAHYKLANYYLDLIHGPGLGSDSDYVMLMAQGDQSETSNTASQRGDRTRRERSQEAPRARVEADRPRPRPSAHRP